MRVAPGEVLSHRRVGRDYHVLTLVAAEIGAEVKPGQFVTISLPEEYAHVLRRPFSVHRVHRRGQWAATIELIFDVRGAGTRYLASLRPHDTVNLIGPLGHGFSLPTRRAHCLLVGGGIGAAPLFFLADVLKERGHRVDFVLGARTSSLLVNPLDVRRLASVYRVTTEDGTQGEKGTVLDVLEETIDYSGSECVYACGPPAMLARVSGLAAARSLPVQVAVEELMACGWGACMSCVVALGDERKGKHYVRVCRDGPVFAGNQVLWEEASPGPEQARAEPAKEVPAPGEAEPPPLGN